MLRKGIGNYTTKMILADVIFLPTGAGDGVRIRFPVKMRRFLSLSPKTYERVAEVIVEAPRAYTEKISVKFVKVSSSCN